MAEISPAGLERDELDALAGEYVLGTLDADERRAAEARMAADRGFRALVAAWENRLQPLADVEQAAHPHANSFGQILARIENAPPIATGGASAVGGGAGDNVVALRRSVRRWRVASFAAAAAAAVLAVFVAVDRVRPPPTEFVAMLTPDGGAPAFILTVDTAQNTLSIRRVADAAPADKSYELWAVEPGQPAKSMGVVEQASLSLDLPFQPRDLVFAISMEPKGGSPTGTATGPVVYSGPLLPAD